MTKAVIYFKNNSGLAIQFAAAGGIIYKQGDAAGQQQDDPDRMAGKRSHVLLRGRLPAVAVIGD